MTTPAGWYPDPEGAGGQRSGGVIAGIIAAVAVLVVVGVAAVWMTMTTDVGESSATTHTPPDAAGDTVAVAAESPAAGIEPTLGDQASGVGRPVRDGNFEFVVSGFERASVVSDPAFPDLQKAASGEYLMVNVKVTNVGTEPQTFFASYNTLSDGTSEFVADDEAWIYLGNTLADLNPGDSIDTAVVFDVPVGTDPESVELHDGPFSDGVVVGL